MAKLSVEPLVSKLELFQLYETEQRMYVVASNSERTHFRMLKIMLLPEEDQVRIGSLAEILSEDSTVYSEEDLNHALSDLHVGNSSTGGLKHVLDCYGLVGFNRFIGCYYLTVITQRRCVGRIGTNKIYTITGVETIPLRREEHDPEASVSSMWGRLQKRLNPTMGDTVEQRYRELFHTVDLTRDFFFSYTYDLTHSLQFNMLATAAQNFPLPPPQEIFMWNHYLLEELDYCVRPKTQWFWFLPIIHGAFQTRRLSLFSRVLSLTLVARRSRHFAGPRYLKRGVNDAGHVANDVEMEQILHEEGIHEGKFSGVTQVRGSIPTFWTQATNWSMPKPPIQIKEHDHPAYEATKRHFAHLIQRYGQEIHLLDLVKLREGKDPRTAKKRETLVGGDYRNAVSYINSDLRPHQRMQYIALDFSNLTKVRNVNLVKGLAEIARWSLSRTSLFCSHPKTQINTDPPKSKSASSGLLGRDSRADLEPTVQRGVLRTNCIDCLDRTNVAQFCVGAVALGIQLNVLGIESTTEIRYDSPVVQALMEMYTSLGDIIALQYGGSEAQKKVDVGGASSKQLSMKQHSDIMTSAKRHLTNTFRDKIVQSAMNLFLGHFRPFTDSAPSGVAPALLGSVNPDPMPAAWPLGWAFGAASASESAQEQKQQIVTLWDLEDDFFLHNKKALRRATPAILVDEWKLLEGDVEDPMMDLDYDYEDEDTGGSFENVIVDELERRNIESEKNKKNVLRRAFRRASKIIKSRKIQKELIAEVQHHVAEPLQADQIEQRLKANERRHQVEQWCRKEFFAASQWWDDAVVRHEQRLQWMRLGPPPAIDMLDRFERLYTPKELTSFDDMLKDEMYVSIAQYEVPSVPPTRINDMPPVPTHVKDRSWDLGPRLGTFSSQSGASDAAASPPTLLEEDVSPTHSPQSSGGLNVSGDGAAAAEVKGETRAEADVESNPASAVLKRSGRSKSYTEGFRHVQQPGLGRSPVRSGSAAPDALQLPVSPIKRADSLPPTAFGTGGVPSPASADSTDPSAASATGEEEDEADRSFTIGGFMMDLGTRLVRTLRTVKRFQNPQKLGAQGRDLNDAGSYFSKAPTLEFIGKANAPDSSLIGNETYAQLAADVSQYETYGNDDIDYDWKHNDAMTDFILESTDAFKLFQLAERSHCTFELSHGPYKDLPQTFDARDLEQLTASVAPIVDHEGRIKDWDEIELALEKEQKGLRKMFGRKTSSTIVDMIKTARETDLELVREYEAAIDPETLRKKGSSLITPEDRALYLSYLDPFREQLKSKAAQPPNGLEPTVNESAKPSVKYPELLAISKVEPTVFIALDCRGLFDDVKAARNEHSWSQDSSEKSE